MDFNVPHFGNRFYKSLDRDALERISPHPRWNRSHIPHIGAHDLRCPRISSTGRLFAPLHRE